MAPESNPGAQTEEKSGSLLALALLAPLVGAAARAVGGNLSACARSGRSLLRRVDRRLVAGGARTLFPELPSTLHSTGPYGSIILGKVGDLAVRSSPSDLQSGVAVNILCRHALSKDAIGQVFAPRQAPCFQAQTPGNAAKVLEG